MRRFRKKGVLEGLHKEIGGLYRSGALVVHGDSFLSVRRHQIVALAARHAVPAIYFNREFVEAGGRGRTGMPSTARSLIHRR